MTDTLPTAPDELWHGTLNGYNNKKCRCAKCKNAASVAGKKKREKNKAKIRGDEPWHGTVSGYSYRSCRCEKCTRAKTLERNTRRETNKEKICGDESWHGTYVGYSNHLCRCHRCKLAAKIHRASKRYGISKDKVKLLLLRCTCEICGTKLPTIKGWFIDHDHSCCPNEKSCGKCVRGLLCSKCNTIIGFASDDPEILKAAIAYLERHSA